MTAALLLTLGLAQAPSTHALIVTGIPGEPRFAEQFRSQRNALAEALRTRYQLPAANVTVLAEAEGPGVAGKATKERVEQEIVRLAGAAGPAGRVLIVFIGHGSDPGDPRFNLPGPDLAASDLKRLLAGFGERQVAVVVAASASGGWVDAVAGPDRLVLTATRTGMERNETRFGEWFARGFGGGAADTDKDGALSLLEAFTYAAAEVKREYESANKLLTERARISDSTLARRFVFGGGEPVVAADSARRGLQERKRDLEARIEALRARKPGMDSTAYERELENLLVELARVNQQLRGRP